MTGPNKLGSLPDGRGSEDAGAGNSRKVKVMMYTQNYSTRRPERRRGTVMLLVVSVLALLAILGTAYIVSARTERGSSRAQTEAGLMDLAQDAVLNQTRQLMYDTTVTRGTTPPNGALPLDGGILPWRPYDSITAGAVQPLVFHLYVINDLVLGYDGVVYKCFKVHTATLTGSSGGAPPTDTTHLIWKVAAVGDENAFYRARDFDYADNIAGQATVPFTAKADKSTLAQHWLAQDLIINTASDLTSLTEKRFDPANGTYDLSFPAVGDINIISKGATDGIWHLLPFSSASGVRYRYALRIVDTNRFANLNTGVFWTPTLAAPDALGQYLLSVNLQQNLDAGDTPQVAQIHGGSPLSRAGTTANTFASATDYDNWQQEVLSSENFGVTPSLGIATWPIAWYDLSDELALRSYNSPTLASTVAPISYVNRPAAIWPSTLGPATAKDKRQFYTTISWDRNLCPLSTQATAVVKPAYKVGGVEWPKDRARFWIANPLVSPVQQVAYLINAMTAAGYTDDEAFSTAVNYLGVVHAADTDPPYIDPSGIWLMGAMGPIPILPKPNRTYVAFRPQPFLNEIAFQTDIDNSGPTPKKTIKDISIALRNPFGSDIDLTGWEITLSSSAFTTIKLPISGITLPSVATNEGLLALDKTRLAAIIPIDLGAAAAAFDLTVTVRRLKGGVAWMVLDSMLVSVDPTTATWYVKQRANNGAGNPWMSASANTELTAPTVTSPALGSPNGAGSSNALLDGFDFFTPMSKLPVGTMITPNVGMLMALSRVAPFTSDVPDNPIPDLTKIMTIPLILRDASRVYAAAATESVFPKEAKVLFDPMVDPRAQRLLQLIATVDRSNIVLGAGSDPLDVARIPGRINVNTASGEVLRALPNLPSGYEDKAVANIMAYRARTKLTFVNSVTGTSTASADFTATEVVQSGVGIRSLAELIVPLGLADGKLTMPAPAANVRNVPKLVVGTGTWANLVGPDSSWAKMFTVCTVRSDTFAVYGVMQAVRQNQYYSGTFNNAMDWYTPVAAPNPTSTVDTGVPIALLSIRRFIAIIDRSWCNYPRKDAAGNSNPDFKLPRIVAFKELPN